MLDIDKHGADSKYLWGNKRAGYEYFQEHKRVIFAAIKEAVKTTSPDSREESSEDRAPERLATWDAIFTEIRLSPAKREEASDEIAASSATNSLERFSLITTR